VLLANLVSQNLIFSSVATKKPRAECDLTPRGLARHDCTPQSGGVVEAHPSFGLRLRHFAVQILQAATVTAPVTTLFPFAATVMFGSLAKSSADDTLMRPIFRITPKYSSFLRVGMAQVATKTGKLKHSETYGAVGRGLACWSSHTDS
jgi:hypothetical protein